MDLKFYPVDMPCEFDFTISRGTTRAVRNIFVELSYQDQSGQNWVGLGEAVPSGYYGETPDSVMGFLGQIQESGFLSTITPFDIQKYNAYIRQFKGYMSAKAALEMAMYDLMGKIAGQPLYRLWGLDAEKPMKSSYTIGIADIEMVKHKTKVALERGYDILKIKVGGPNDLETLKVIRQIAPDATIRVDANAAWEPDDAIAMFPILVDHGVEFVEEPLLPDTRMAERLRVKEASPIPILADESVHTMKDIPLVLNRFDGINLKLTKTGGLYEAMQMIYTARAFGLKIMLGCFPESSLSITAFAHLAPLVDYLDLDGGLLLAEDPVVGIRWEGNRLFLPDKPGLGVTKKAEVFTS